MAEATRLYEAQRYRGQGYHPIPMEPGTKKSALEPGERTIYQRRQPNDTELSRWFGTGDDNIALELGPTTHLLVLNVNMKRGYDGWAALDGYPLPATPTILTPHGGAALLFRPPDREQYPSLFKTHTRPREFPGIELRGTGGYQVVPSSIVDGRAYRWQAPWTLTRLLGDCAELPAWLLDYWMALDREPRELSTGRGHPRAPLTTPRHPQKPVSLSGPYTVVEKRYSTTVYGFSGEAPEHLGNTGLSALVQDVSAQVAGAYWLAQRLKIPAEAVAHVGRNFHCVLPGHVDNHPSASLHWSRSGELMYRDWHGLEGREWWSLPEVYAAVMIGTTQPLPAPSFATWRLRLLVEAGVLAPYPVALPPLPDDAPRTVARVYEGFRLLLACKWHYAPGAPTMFARTFAAGWCGVGQVSAWEATRWLVEHHIIRPAGTYRGRPLYRPADDGA